MVYLVVFSSVTHLSLSHTLLCNAAYVSRQSVCISQRQTAVKTSVYHTMCVPLCLLLNLFLSGWFCVSAAWNSQPFDLDNYTNANCLCPATSTGGRCQVGFYCPLGSSEPMHCPPGTFCNISGIWTPIIIDIVVHTSKYVKCNIFWHMS